MKQTPFLRALVLLSILVPTISAIAEVCPELKTVDQLEFPKGQLAATTMGASPKVETPVRHIPVPDGPLETVRVTLVRTECYGACPSYSVELSGDGTASYDGKADVLVTGHHTFSVPKSSVECLLFYLGKADFWSLADKYVANITDGPQYYLTLKIGDQSKSVLDYFGPVVGLPPFVTAIENEIDRIGSDLWVNGTKETLPVLRAEHFDFHSQAAATLLANAAGDAPIDLVEGLIAAGAPTTGRIGPTWLKDRLTTLELASRAGRISVVRSLIAAGGLSDASPNLKDQTLINAAESGNPKVVVEILKFNPNVNATDSQGRTALIAMGTNRDVPDRDVPGVARALIAAGADPNVASYDGTTALFGASDAEVVRLLLKAGAKIDVRNKYGSTPLLYASSDEVALALIEAGADVTAHNELGDDIAKEADRRKFSKTLKALRDRAAKR